MLYGIPNCDTVKKARNWLDAEGFSYTFHDYKKVGINSERLGLWCQAAGWEKVLNRAGTTFRKLPESDREGLDIIRAINLMCAYPSAIKRPIVEHAGTILVGFDADRWASVLR